MRIGTSGALYIALTLLLGFSAINTGNNLLFLVVAGLLAFMSVTGLAGMFNLRKLTPELLPPAEIFAGTLAPFRLRLHNTKRYIPSFLIRLEVSGGGSVTIPMILAGSSADGTVGLAFPVRGYAGVRSVVLSSPFPVNFFIRSRIFPLDPNCIIFPRLLSGMAVDPGREAERAGQAARQAHGLDGELESITGYSGREPLRMIHWKHTARTDELLVKEFGLLTAPPLFIELDALAGTTLEDRISHAAWLVQHWAGQRPVGLRLSDRSVPAGMGQHHRLFLLKELALYGND
ncbi:DUF58 domain-containing protein [Geobacter sp. SVR]|uniref:DUF58 domain-containing protein n=1 Tax=Geobacter sp. SVR TaxID=2495594 RepID=UPI00143EFADF|nr:DUF58 domain-containing protein [Geobacter sp. SVR]GCF84149.1 hypothetical protein GSbR_07490 [Geobacter sp. SVR]